MLQGEEDIEACAARGEGAQGGAFSFGEFADAVGVVADVDASRVCVDDAVNDGEAQACARAAGGEEGVEHAGDDFGRDAWATVADAEAHDGDAGAAADGGADARATEFEAVFALFGGHGLHGVLHDVDEGLREQGGVAREFGAAAVADDVEMGHFGALVLADGEDAVEEISGGDGLHAELEFACEAEDITHDVLDDAGGRVDLSSDRGFGRVGGEVFLEHAGVEADGAEGIAHFVSDAGGHFSQRGETLAALDLFVGFVQFAGEAGDFGAERVVGGLQFACDVVEGREQAGEIGGSQAGGRSVAHA